MEEKNTDKQVQKQTYDWLKPYQFVKGQSGNPKGRPPGKSLRTFVKELLEEMPDEEKIEYLKTLDPNLVWQMAEGKPKQAVIGGDEDDNPINITISKEIADKYETPPSSK